jgi:hypothetical protein
MRRPKKEGRDEKTGRFLPGNGYGGRPLGSRNKLSEAFLADFEKVWRERGIEALRECPAKDLVKVAAMLCPKDIQLDVTPLAATVIEDMTEFVRDYRLVRAAAANIGAKPLLLEAEDV